MFDAIRRSANDSGLIERGGLNVAGRRKKKDSFGSERRAREEATSQTAAGLAEGEGEVGRVIAHHGVAVLVHFESGEERQLWLTHEQKAVVGDRVRVAGARMVVDPAHGVLRRRDPRGRERTIATNLDLLGIVVAPEPREPPGYIDRGFVIARAAGIEPMVIMNKADLDEGEMLATRLVEIYSNSAQVLIASANRGRGLDAIARVIPAAHVAALVGPSGVGKSSILNALVPDLDLRVSELNRGSGKGRHTTTTATLHALASGGFLVDTAGFKDFIAVGVPTGELALYFPGFEQAVSQGCKFRDCRHRTEPGCSVLAAVERGEIPARRHGAYLQLLDESESPDGRS